MADHRTRSPTRKPDGILTDAVESFALQPLQDGQGTRKITGVAKQADRINLNRRFFSLPVLTAMCSAAQDAVKGGELYGLVQHPDPWWEGPKGLIENIGVKYDRLWMDGDLLRFEGSVVQTTKGKDLQAVLDAGVKVGMSTNVTGSARYLPAKEVDPEWPDPEETIQVVNDDARLITIDAVMGPADLAGELNAADAMKAGQVRSEAEFIDEMIPHHQLAIDMAEKALGFIEHEELKTLAKNIVATQGKEIKTMRRIRKTLDSAEGVDVVNLDELKKKHPDLYAQAVADGKKEAGASSLEDQLASERAARLKLEREIQDGKREGIARTALTDARLPKLGKSGDIDLDARFEKRVTDAALRADSDEEARAEVAALIAERKLTTRTDERDADNNPGLGSESVQDAGGGKSASKSRSTFQAARRNFGL
ncbi:hypothetical protein Dcar01_03539 [Deinococcus carri]|uniref:DUF305 domain-containing protein n=1 Tax=Deinococcus carri TaxID=1211323 RepID=A0ABP9WFB8_9DEIO